MVQPFMGINDRFSLHQRLNPHQQKAAKERKRRKVKMVYCIVCRRYCWAEIGYDAYHCLECGCVIPKEKEKCQGKQQ